MAGPRNKKPLTIQQVGDLHGKTPPQDVELEKVVLGALLLERNAAAEVMSLLTPETFYHQSHSAIFEAIQEMYAASLPIDILTVTTKLRKNGKLEIAGGPYYISKLTDRVGSTVNTEYHSRILIEHAIKRKLIEISDNITREAYDDVTDCFDLVDSAVNMMMLVNSNLSDTAGNFKSADKISMEAHEHYERVKALGGNGITGVPSGLSNLDSVTGGAQGGNLIVFAARPGMGKTALMLTMARNAAVDFKKPVGIVSLEMQSVGLMQRLQAMETGVNSQSIKKGLMSDEQYMDFRTKLGKLENAPIYIDETPGQTVNAIRSKAHQLKQKYDIQMLMVDYLQLVEVPAAQSKGFREQEVAFISKNLKKLSKELNIPIIALSQLSREVEKRADKRPQLSDIRESGAIEQDADIIGFLYRPDYYGLTKPGGEEYAPGYTELIIAKNRDGDLDDIKLTFHPGTTTFTDYSEFNAYGTPHPPDKSDALKANTGFEAPQPTDDLPF